MEILICLFNLIKKYRDRSDHHASDFYHLEQDEKEQLIDDDNDDVVHFSASQPGGGGGGGFQIDSFKDNLEYHLGTIKSTLGN